MRSADLCHEVLIKTIKPTLAYDEAKDFETWREQVREKFLELLGDLPSKCSLYIRVEWEKEHENFYEKRLLFCPEENIDIPCHLWIPKNVKLPCPVVICLQGHTTGMHISMGRSVNEGDEAFLGGSRDIANQAIANGYAALTMELRGFGELKSQLQLNIFPDAISTCAHPAMTANLLGRTLMGERVWDISRAVDMLETMPDVIDTKKILVTGNSGGGTAAYYAACFDPRIAMAVPCCSVCSFKYSIVWKRHCACNYIPGMAKHLDMGELACLIAPRPLAIVAGVNDNGLHIDGSREAAAIAEKIYQKAGASDKFRFLEGQGEQQYYPELSWPVVHELFD